MKSLKSLFSNPKIDLKDISGTKKPLLLFHTRYDGYFNPKNDNDDIKDYTKIEELEKHFAIPYPYIYKEDHPKTKEAVKESNDKMDKLQKAINDLKKKKKAEKVFIHQYDFQIENLEEKYKRYEYDLSRGISSNYYDHAHDLYSDVKNKIFRELNDSRLYGDIRLCKGLGSDVLDKRIMNSSDPDIIITIFADKKIAGFAYIAIKEEYIVNTGKSGKNNMGKVLYITAICSDDSIDTSDGIYVKGIGSSLIESIEKIGKVFDCNAIVVDSPRDTTKFFEKMGFEKLKGQLMILDLHNHNIVHTIIDDDNTVDTRKASKKGGKSHKKSRKSNRKPHKYTRKSR